MAQRLFVAIDAGPDLAAEVGRALARVRSHAARASWAGDTTGHLTLVFLGNVPDDRVDPVREVVREAAGRHRPFTFHLQGAGAFGHPTHPRTLWAGVEGGRESLLALAADLRHSLVQLGLQLEARAYHPHLTLARARGDRGDSGLARCVAELRDRAFGAVHADAIKLFRSELLPSGARHHVVERCALGDSPADARGPERP